MEREDADVCMSLGRELLIKTVTRVEREQCTEEVQDTEGGVVVVEVVVWWRR